MSQVSRILALAAAGAITTVPASLGPSYSSHSTDPQVSNSSCCRVGDTNFYVYTWYYTGWKTLYGKVVEYNPSTDSFTTGSRYQISTGWTTERYNSTVHYERNPNTSEHFCAVIAQTGTYYPAIVRFKVRTSNLTLDNISATQISTDSGEEPVKGASMVYLDGQGSGGSSGDDVRAFFLHRNNAGIRAAIYYPYGTSTLRSWVQITGASGYRRNNNFCPVYTKNGRVYAFFYTSSALSYLHFKVSSNGTNIGQEEAGSMSNGTGSTNTNPTGAWYDADVNRMYVPYDYAYTQQNTWDRRLWVLEPDTSSAPYFSYNAYHNLSTSYTNVPNNEQNIIASYEPVSKSGMVFGYSYSNRIAVNQIVTDSSGNFVEVLYLGSTETGSSINSMTQIAPYDEESSFLMYGISNQSTSYIRKINGQY